MAECDSALIEWRRVFVRSGVRFVDFGSHFDFSQETTTNREFLQQVLACGGWAPLNGVRFTPRVTTIDERQWLDCWERLHSGAEAGATGFENIELELMDTYIAGVIRWLNALGVRTFISCDGHGRRAPYIDADPRDIERTANLIEIASAGQLLYEGRHIVRRDSTGLSASPERREQPPRRRWPERRQLLDLAEHLHRLYALEVAGRGPGTSD